MFGDAVSTAKLTTSKKGNTTINNIKTVFFLSKSQSKNGGFFCLCFGWVFELHFGYMKEWHFCAMLLFILPCANREIIFIVVIVEAIFIRRIDLVDNDFIVKFSTNHMSFTIYLSHSRFTTCKRLTRYKANVTRHYHSISFSFSLFLCCTHTNACSVHI